MHALSPVFRDHHTMQSLIARRRVDAVRAPFLGGATHRVFGGLDRVGDTSLSTCEEAGPAKIVAATVTVDFIGPELARGVLELLGISVVAALCEMRAITSRLEPRARSAVIIAVGEVLALPAPSQVGSQA